VVRSFMRMKSVRRRSSPRYGAQLLIARATGSLTAVSGALLGRSEGAIGDLGQGVSDNVGRGETATGGGCLEVLKGHVCLSCYP
jgi:hypothetical protein